MTAPGVLAYRLTLPDLTLSSASRLDGVVLETLDWDQYGRDARALLNDAYSAGGGDILDFGRWRDQLFTDAQFDAELCLIARHKEDPSLVGVIHGWTTGFIKDIAVTGSARRQGVARALLAEMAARYCARGVKALTLKVTADNPSQAPRFYERLGFERVDAL